MKIKPFILALLLAMALPLASCEEEMIKTVNENGEVNEEDLPEAGLDFTVANALPSYDATNLPQSDVYVSKEELISYYARNLNTRCIADYNDIKNALVKFSKEVLLTKLISEEELFQIMSIINIDEPTYFMMDTKYSYTLTADGYVNKVSLYYTMSKADYEKAYEKYFENLSSFYGSISTDGGFNSTIGTEYEVEKAAMAQLPSLSVMGDETKDSSAMAIVNGEGNPYSIPKYMTALCRYVGLDCVTKIGIPTSEKLKGTLKQSGFYVDELKDVASYTTTDGDIKTVNYDFDGYCMWNMVKIGEEWYNIDTVLQTIVANFYNDKVFPDTFSTKNLMAEEGLLTNVNDYTISMSRMSYVTDNILGLSPSGTEKTFQSSYRNAKYVLSMSTSQVVQYLTKRILEYKNEDTYILYQMEDEDTFDAFLNVFDDQIEAYNNASKNKILSYAYSYDRDTLTFIVYNLKYKE